MSAQGYFVTGTDTAVGKTGFTVALMSRLQRQGRQVNGMKPVASGCDEVSGKVVNADALTLQAHSSVSHVYEKVNPYAFMPAIAPHFAAAAVGVEIDPVRIAHCYAALAETADIMLVEGAGGWCVPLGQHRFWQDLVKQLDLKVILVVAMRLGCINHALLTAQAITASACQLSAWVANEVDGDYAELQKTVDCLQAAIAAPCLGVLLHNDTGEPDCSGSDLDLSTFDPVSCGI